MKRDVGGRLRDGEAFDRLVEEHYDDVLAYCRRHAPSYDEAPDVAQEAFLRFVRSGRSPIEGKPLAYLLTIARNLCIDASRATSRRRRSAFRILLPSLSRYASSVWGLWAIIPHFKQGR